MAQQRTTTITAEAAGIIALGGDLPVRRMGFGAMRVTGEGIWGEPDDPGECQRARRRALQVGGEEKLRKMGLWNGDGDQRERAKRMTPMLSVQNKYSLTDRSSEPVLQDCEERGLVFIPWRPVADSSERQGGPLHEIASRYRATPSQVALAWLLAHSSATLLIPRTSKVAPLRENVAAA